MTRASCLNLSVPFINTAFYNNALQCFSFLLQSSCQDTKHCLENFLRNPRSHTVFLAHPSERLSILGLSYSLPMHLLHSTNSDPLQRSMHIYCIEGLWTYFITDEVFAASNQVERHWWRFAKFSKEWDFVERVRCDCLYDIPAGAKESMCLSIQLLLDIAISMLVPIYLGSVLVWVSAGISSSTAPVKTACPLYPFESWLVKN